LNDGEIRSLGHDILWCGATDPSHEKIVGRTRFLDHLWLPSALAELTPEQILVINRYRESVIKVVGPYDNVRRAHNMLIEAIRGAQASAILEVGCGKFPISARCERYLGIDIDPEAVAFVQSQGRSAISPEKLLASAAAPFDCVVSAYVMHFAVSEGFLADIDAVASADAIFCFNLIAEEGLGTISILAKICHSWPLINIIKTSGMARREFFFVAGRSGANSRLMAAARAIELCDPDLQSIGN